jgi:hypothetical protein
MFMGRARFSKDKESSAWLQLFPRQERDIACELFQSAAVAGRESAEVLAAVRLKAICVWLDPHALDATTLLAVKRSIVLMTRFPELAEDAAAAALAERFQEAPR